MQRCAVFSILSVTGFCTSFAGEAGRDLSEIRIGGYLGDTKAGRILGAIQQAEALWMSSPRDGYSYSISYSSVLSPGPAYEIRVQNGACTARLILSLGKRIQDGTVEACGEWQSIEGAFMHARWVATSGAVVAFDQSLGYVSSITYLDGSMHISDFKSLVGRLTNTCSAPGGIKCSAAGE
jgi:hypothetical protein